MDYFIDLFFTIILGIGIGIVISKLLLLIPIGWL
jgi:hypothetical protein